MTHDVDSRKNPLTRADFVKAVQRYARVVFIGGLCAFALFDLGMGLTVVALSPHAADWELPKKLVVFLPLGTLSVALPIAFLIVVVKRARRNATLLCTSCGESLASWEASRHILATGMCPHCRQHLFKGSLASSDEAAERLEKLKQDVRGHLRFAIKAWIIGLVGIYALLIWGASTAPPTREIDWEILMTLPMSFPVLVLGGMWIAARGDIRRAARHARAMQTPERGA